VGFLSKALTALILDKKARQGLEKRRRASAEARRRAEIEAGKTERERLIEAAMRIRAQKQEIIADLDEAQRQQLVEKILGEQGKDDG